VSSGGSSDDPLLVVVDMQRVFAELDSPWYLGGFHGLVEPIERLLLVFPERTVFSRFVVPEDPEGGWLDYYRQWSFVREPGATSLLELAEPWNGRGFPVLDKPSFSAFGPALQARAGNGTIVLCGVSTECCVLATAIQAADAGISVRIVADACASLDQSTHDSALHVAVTGFSPLIAITTVAEELGG